MNKNFLLLISIIFLFLIINSIDAAICKGWDGYYHDCYYDYWHNYPIYKKVYYIDNIHLNKYYDNYKYEKIYPKYKETDKIYVIKDERNYEINIIQNEDKKFNIYLDIQKIRIREPRTRYSEKCPEGFSCFKTNYT